MYVVVVAIAAAVFAADIVAPLGISVWILFIPAVILCMLFTWRPLAPLAVACATSALIVVGSSRPSGHRSFRNSRRSTEASVSRRC